MSYIDRNLTVLEKKFAHVAHKLVHTPKEDLISLVDYTEHYEKDEAWLEAVKSSVGEAQLILVYGFGQGLAIADLLEMYSDRWLFVYEPNERLFMDSMLQYDYTVLLEHPNLRYLALGDSQINMLFSLVSSFMQGEMAFVSLRHYLEKDMNKLKEIKEDFIKYNITFETNKRTYHFFKDKWLKNSMAQIPGILSSPSIEHLRNRFPNTTAVVIGSGPSLQKDIHWIKKLEHHALIIAAGSSIQALVQHGIYPHLTVVMDGGSINDVIFKNPETLVAPLLSTTSAYFKIAASKNSEVIYSVLRNDTIAQYCLNREKDDFLLEPTETVTGTAMQAAIWMGARRIIMMGQDLSFPGEKFYADGVSHVHESYVTRSLNSASLQVKNVQGSYNATNQNFLFMKHGLENLISAFSSVEFINTTRDGAAIEGSIWKPVEDVYELIKDEVVEEKSISKLLQKMEVTLDINYLMDVEERLKYTIGDISNALKEIQLIKKMLNQLPGLSREKPLKAQQVLENIEHAWANIANRSWFEAISEFMLPIPLNEFDKQLPAIVMEKNIRVKSDLIYTHLSKLLKDIESVLPYVMGVFEETECQLQQLK